MKQLSISPHGIFLLVLTLSLALSLHGQDKIVAKATTFIAGNEEELPSSGMPVTQNSMFFDATNAAFRSGRLFNSDAWGVRGAYSFAVGFNNKATSSSTAAFGVATTASGVGSTSFGTGSIASASYATAFGLISKAAGQNSLAAGQATMADSYNGVAFGRYNIGGGVSSSWVDTDPVFEVGNGGSNTTRNNAFTILKNGVLISNSHILPSSSSISKNLMFFDPITGSFRAGKLDNSTAWAVLGDGTFATGTNTRSSGINSAAFGSSTESTGGASVAFGTNTAASNSNSASFGLFTNAIGRNALSAGQWTSAQARGSVAVGQYNVGNGNPEDWLSDDPLFEMGNGTGTNDKKNAFTVLKNGSTILNHHTIPAGTTVSSTHLAFYDATRGSLIGGTFSPSYTWSEIGDYAFGYGINIVPSGLYSIALGNGTIASGSSSLATGLNTTAEDFASASFGYETIAKSFGSMAIGRFNRGLGGTSTWAPHEPLLEVGIGSSSSARKNAMEIRKSGQIAIGDIQALENIPLFAKIVISSNTVDEGALTVTDNENIAFRVNAGGSVSMGANAPSAMNLGDAFISNRLGIGKTPAVELDINGVGKFSANSGTNISQLNLHETASDYARLDFTNTNPETKWTIAARPESVIANSRFNLFLEGAGNILVVQGDSKLGIGRTPSHPLHVGDDPLTGNGAHVTGGGTWTNGSSRTFKENFQEVNSDEILSALIGLDIQKWEYKGSDEGTHLGPIAEEFYEAFGLGSDEKYISTVDIDGVALAAIQALAKENEDLKKRLKKLEEIIIKIENN